MLFDDSIELNGMREGQPETAGGSAGPAESAGPVENEDATGSGSQMKAPPSPSPRAGRKPEHQQIRNRFREAFKRQFRSRDERRMLIKV
jgi:hypothetical protein